MIIKLYVKPGEDPSKIANEAKGIVEQQTGMPCNVKVTGSSTVNSSNRLIAGISMPSYG